MSSSIEDNIKFMYEKYGFFIPDKEFLVDSEGLIGYCAEKVKLGHICLYCQHIFTTWQGCQKHMVDTRHTKLRYEVGVDLDEFDVFYDFTEDDKEFLDVGLGNHKRRKKKTDICEVGQSLDAMVIDEDDGEDDEEWEDIDSDDEMEEDVKDGLYAAYEDELARHGFDITPLGELIFPSGKIVGHRGLAKYYRQRFAPEDSRPSVTAAKKASGEHLFNGRVYDIHSQNGHQKKNDSNTSIISLAKAGLSMGAARGRSGKGILVSTSGALNGASSFTALSLYRYKAALKKSRREEFKARRLVERTSQPMNKMDKKGNRMITGVSVAHAPR
jgi:pre-60S factor REI1